MTSTPARLWVTLSVLSSIFGSCTRPVEPPELPQSVSPGWQLIGVQEVTPHAVWIASYSGPGAAHVRIWAVRGSAEGLDRMQKWQPEANTVVFYSERYFAAVDWTNVDRTQVGPLVRAIEHATGVQPSARQ
jgi:hypothetical protein